MEYEEATWRFEKDSNDYNRSRFNEIKEKLELFYEEKTHGIILRARACGHEHGERSTNYFLNLEKRNHVMAIESLKFLSLLNVPTT